MLRLILLSPNHEMKTCVHIPMYARRRALKQFAGFRTRSSMTCTPTGLANHKRATCCRGLCPWPPNVTN